MKYLSLFAFFVSVSALSADEASLPKDAKELLSKLENFEHEQLAKAHAVISEKRAGVVGVLKSQMDRETRAGNLEGALALKGKIESLSTEKFETAPSDASKAGNAPSKETAFFVGPVWFMGDEKNPYSSFKFEADGTGEKVFRGKPLELTWTMTPEGGLHIQIGKIEKHFIVDARRKQVWGRADNGGKGEEWKMKEGTSRGQEKGGK